MNATLKGNLGNPVLPVALLGNVLLAGCSFKHNDAIAFVTSTQAGIRVGTDTTQKPEIQVGYNRQEFALVPVYKSGMHDGMSANHPVVAGILRQAGETIEQARGSFGLDGKLTPAGQTGLKLAADLIAVAEFESRTQGDSTDKQTSRLLAALKQQTGDLVRSAKEDKADLEPKMALVQNLIEVEAQKPMLIAEFKEHMKYVGEESGPDTRKDAYSVFGSFTGRASAERKASTGDTAGTEGGLAQFFATGVAAQILAKEGGAAAISTSVQSPAQIRAQAEVTEIQQQKVKDLETVMDFVTQNSNTDRGKLEKLLKGPGDRYLRRTENWPGDFGGEPATALRDHLVGEGNRHVEEMANRARLLQSENSN